MKNLLMILVVTALFACNKSNDVEILSAYYINTSVEFSIINSQNEDLLDSNNPNHINEENIKLFYVIDGENQEVYDSNMDYPRNFLIYKHENEYRIRVFLNNSETSEKPITYIQWNESDIDTIEVTIKRTQISELKDEIWLNGIHVWERGDDTIEAYFVLTK